jgi:hypothetical protein
MNLKTRRGAKSAWLVALALAAAAGYAASPSARAGGAASAAQDPIMLERRISMVEQRLNTIELTVNRLEQIQRLPQPAAPNTSALRDTELELLRSQIELLQRRVAEDECGLVKLDERTLSPSARAARRKDVGDKDDPCRLNPDTPLRLSARQ